jgi:hypothetical protein
MTTQTENKMIEVIDNYIKYTLTEYDGGKVIYQHLLEQTEENLEDWVNDKFRDWLGNECCYDFNILVCKKCGYKCEDCECEVKETEEEEITITSISITRYIGYMIDREVEKQMEEMEIPDPLPTWVGSRFGWLCVARKITEEKEKKKFYDNIFSNCRELLEVINKLKDYYNEFDIKFDNNFEEFMLKYCYMYISQMEATDLKEYIINLIDPVEPK